MRQEIGTSECTLLVFSLRTGVLEQDVSPTLTYHIVIVVCCKYAQKLLTSVLSHGFRCGADETAVEVSWEGAWL